MTTNKTSQDHIYVSSLKAPIAQRRHPRRCRLGHPKLDSIDYVLGAALTLVVASVHQLHNPQPTPPQRAKQRTMGQVCSGEKAESRKAGVFEDVAVVSESMSPDMMEDVPSSKQGIQSVEDLTTTKEQAEQLKALREEQARLDMIVTAAGRNMVAVRSTRGTTGYYDQGFAGALAQHLEQTTQFTDRLEVRLPPPSMKSSVYERLGRPQWDGIMLGKTGGLAGCGGENPQTYMDNVAESLLDSVVPTKQQLFAGVPPMVENLL